MVVLLLEEVDGECCVLARPSAHAEVLVAGLDHLERCPVIPQRVLEEQGAKRLQLALQLWFGVGQTVHFETVHGLVEVQVLLVVQNDVFALVRARRAARFATVAREAEPAANSLPGNGVAGLESLDGLRGGRGLHGMLAGLRLLGFSFSLRSDPLQFLFCEWTTKHYPYYKKKNKGTPCILFFILKERCICFLTRVLEDQLRFHKGRHEIPAVHRTAIFIRFVNCKEPLCVSRHNVIYAVRCFLTEGSQYGDHRDAAILRALRVRTNGPLVQMLEVGKFGGNVNIRGSGSHTVCSLVLVLGEY
jgi:hypothetical protein